MNKKEMHKSCYRLTDLFAIAFLKYMGIAPSEIKVDVAHRCVYCYEWTDLLVDTVSSFNSGKFSVNITEYLQCVRSVKAEMTKQQHTLKPQ